MQSCKENGRKRKTKNNLALQFRFIFVFLSICPPPLDNIILQIKINFHYYKKQKPSSLRYVTTLSLHSDLTKKKNLIIQLKDKIQVNKKKVLCHILRSEMRKK